MFAKNFLTGVAVAATLGMAGMATAQQTFITIGTGGVTRVYIPPAERFAAL